jgi:DNA-binding GntR family transcriptional regulator
MLSLLQQDDYQLIIQEYLDLDREFHRYFVQLAQNSKLSAMHAQINTHLHVARLRARFARTDSDGTQSEHEAILAALDARDSGALVEAIADHINLAKNRTLDALQDE